MHTGVLPHQSAVQVRQGGEQFGPAGIRRATRLRGIERAGLPARGGTAGRALGALHLPAPGRDVQVRQHVHVHQDAVVYMEDSNQFVEHRLVVFPIDGEQGVPQQLERRQRLD